MRFFSILLAVLTLFLSGCSIIPKPKWPAWASFGNKDTVTNNSGTVAEAASGQQAVDRMAEIARRQEETRLALEAKYAKFRQELQAAYDLRTKVDNENFDAISDINQGIYLALEPITSTNTRVLIASLKAQENIARLMPITEKRKDEIKVELAAQEKMKTEEIQKIYDARIKAGEAKNDEYNKADAAVKAKEAEKAKIRTEADQILAKAKAEHEAEVARMKKEADDAVAIAKEKQRQEMIGWIVKGLLGVGIVVLIIGLLMKAPTMIISGIFCLGLAYVAATVAMWIIASIMGLVVLAMVLLDHKTGKPHFMKKTEVQPIAPPPSVTPPSA
jgi:hypothetical protein